MTDKKSYYHSCWTELTCQGILIFFSLFSFILAWTFISLQIKEFRIMGLSINDSVYSCLFFFLTGLHFFHLLLGLLLLSLLFWSCSFSFLSLDWCSISSRKVFILWTFNDIILLFSSYVYLIFHLFLVVLLFLLQLE